MASDAALLVGCTAAMLGAYYVSKGRPVLQSRLISAAILGLTVPLAWGLGYPLSVVGPGDWLAAIGWGVAAGLIMQPGLWISSGSAASQSLRPELRSERWTPQLRAQNAATWAIYLVAYEACFRGVLLQGLAPSLGEGTATGVVLALYALYHLHKAWDETAGSFLAGLVFGWIALRTDTFLGPLVAHWLIAVGSDTWAVARRPA